MTDDELDDLLHAGMSPEFIEAEEAYWRAAQGFGMAELRRITAEEINAPEVILCKMREAAKLALEEAKWRRDRLVVFQSEQINRDIEAENASQQEGSPGGEAAGEGSGVH